MYTLKTGETVLTEEGLRTISANERRSSYFTTGTTFDFNSPTLQLVSYQSIKGRPLVKFANILKSTDGRNFTEATVPASLLMRVPFSDENKTAIAKTQLQKDIIAATNAAEFFNLIKGKKIRVTEVVDVLEIPYGKDKPETVKYSVFDLA